MRIIIRYEGVEYKTPDAPQMSATEAAGSLYEVMGKLEKLRFDLEGGGILLLGKEACSRAAVIVVESLPPVPDEAD